MKSIFFDLETSSQDPIGQIVNCCFLFLGDNFEVLEEFYEDILLSPLELPVPGAILANRVNVEEHQRSAARYEHEVLPSLAQWIDHCLQCAKEKVALVGYNSLRFDVPFLRTSFIRNGISPYFYGKLINRDLLLAVRKLSISSETFPRPNRPTDASKLSLSLESVTRALGLLEGRQSHHSRDDVLLTIELAKHCLNNYSLDVRTYEPYEALGFHDIFLRGKGPVILEELSPNYDLSTEARFTASSKLLVDCDRRGNALWQDLRVVKDLSELSVQWRSAQSQALYVGKDISTDEDLQRLALEARKASPELSLENFFKRPDCDIEQHIYRLHDDGFSALDVLGEGIRTHARPASDNRDVQVLFLRYFMRLSALKPSQTEAERKLIDRYVRYRYGGEMKLSKGERIRTHPSFKDLLHLLDSEQKTAKDDDDKELLEALSRYYKNSLIASVMEAQRSAARPAAKSPQKERGL